MRRFGAMVAYVPRACLPPKRLLILAIPVLSALLLGLLTHVVALDADEAFANVADIGLFGLVLPLGALVIGDAVMGAEVRSGALPFTWLSPVPFAQIAAARWLGAVAIGGATLLPACLAAALIAGVPAALGPLALAVIAMLAAHLAVFVLIGVVTRRAAVWSLAVVLLFERLLGAALGSVAALSPTWLGRAVFTNLGPGAADRIRDDIPDGSEALVRLAIITVLALALTAWRLGAVRLTGTRD